MGQYWVWLFKYTKKDQMWFGMFASLFRRIFKTVCKCACVYMLPHNVIFGKGTCTIYLRYCYIVWVTTVQLTEAACLQNCIYKYRKYFRFPPQRNVDVSKRLNVLYVLVPATWEHRSEPKYARDVSNCYYRPSCLCLTSLFVLWLIMDNNMVGTRRCDRFACKPALGTHIAIHNFRHWCYHQVKN
jgi:hypothetical protein